MVDARTAVFSITSRQMPAIARLKRVAVASTVEAAVLAARNFEGDDTEPGTLIEGRLLPPDPEIFETSIWGIRSLAEPVRLLEKGIAERLGERGLQLQKLARGRWRGR